MHVRDIVADARTDTKIETKSIIPCFGLSPTGANNDVMVHCAHMKSTTCWIGAVPTIGVIEWL